MATRIIRIMKGFSDGTLEMSDNNHPKVKRGETIKWQIDDNSNVNSIEEIYEKPISTNIFSISPRLKSKTWEGEIDKHAPYYDDYNYAILWKGKWGTLLCDPKISVEPPTFNFLKVLFMAISVMLTAFFSLKFFRNCKKKSGISTR